jgi:hypothetical protein
MIKHASKFGAALAASVIAISAGPASAQQQQPAAQPAAPRPRPPACAEDPRYALQDFTVGHWDVYNGERKTAEVKMEKVLNGCSILETWMTAQGVPNANGYFNYNRDHDIWQYFWTSNSGDTTYFKGALVEPGNMRFITAYPRAQGERLEHWSLIAKPDGTVQELSRTTDDGGKTWRTGYDLTWRKKN